MIRKELLATPQRKWNEVLHNVGSVWVIPNRHKHDSGWMCMNFVASFTDNRPMVQFGGGCDDVRFVGDTFHMDCDYPSGIIHIWSRKPFMVTHDVSSIDFIVEGEKE